MELIRIYQCLCDRTRLRILHLLTSGPLCVCHFQMILREPQVKVSKHLGYLKRNGMVESERCGNMVIYQLPKKRSAKLEANLACLQDCLMDEKAFRDDAKLLEKVRKGFGDDTPECVREGELLCCK